MVGFIMEVSICSDGRKYFNYEKRQFLSYFYSCIDTS